MSMDLSTMHLWPAEQCAKEWEWRRDVLPTLVGPLYPDVVRDQMAQINDMCAKRFGWGAAFLREKGIVPSTITINGVMHAYGRASSCSVLFRSGTKMLSHDEPMKMVTCISCLARGL